MKKGLRTIYFKTLLGYANVNFVVTFTLSAAASNLKIKRIY